MEIEISGYRVLIDDEDCERVSKHKWSLDESYMKREGTPYFRTTLPNGKKGLTISLHRFIMQCA